MQTITQFSHIDKVSVNNYAHATLKMQSRSPSGLSVKPSCMGTSLKPSGREMVRDWKNLVRNILASIYMQGNILKCPKKLLSIEKIVVTHHSKVFPNAGSRANSKRKENKPIRPACNKD